MFRLRVDGIPRRVETDDRTSPDDREDYPMTEVEIRPGILRRARGIPPALAREILLVFRGIHRDGPETPAALGRENLLSPDLENPLVLLHGIHPDSQGILHRVPGTPPALLPEIVRAQAD